MAKKPSNDSNNILAFLCYLLWPVGLILLLLDKAEGNLRYHAWNGIGLAIVWWVLWIVCSWFLFTFWFLSDLVGLLGLIYAILLGVKAYNGERPEIPLVTDLVRKNVKKL